MEFNISTNGHSDIINITEKVKKIIKEVKIEDGIATIFVSGSTAAITTIEDEEGLKEDFNELMEKLAPEDKDYKHHQAWGDRNGAAHLKSALIGTSLTVPIDKNDLSLGTWQQIVLIDFDEKERDRKIIVKIISS
ncbi:MAG: secondary thiamine-phosphate synthase enzyme YjbQ [Parcubacteria group bacterium]